MDGSHCTGLGAIPSVRTERADALTMTMLFPLCKKQAIIWRVTFSRQYRVTTTTANCLFVSVQWKSLSLISLLGDCITVRKIFPEVGRGEAIDVHLL